MTSGGDSFNDVPETVPTREITNKTEKTLVVFSSAAVRGLFLAWAQCCSIHSTHLNPAALGFTLGWRYMQCRSVGRSVGRATCRSADAAFCGSRKVDCSFAAAASAARRTDARRSVYCVRIMDVSFPCTFVPGNETTCPYSQLSIRSSR